VIVALGFDPLSGVRPTTPSPGFFAVSDVVWWLWETVVVLGLVWRATKTPRPAVAVWVALLWLLASAARFTPLILTATIR